MAADGEDLSKAQLRALLAEREAEVEALRAQLQQRPQRAETPKNRGVKRPPTSSPSANLEKPSKKQKFDKQKKKKKKKKGECSAGRLIRWKETQSNVQGSENSTS